MNIDLCLQLGLIKANKLPNNFKAQENLQKSAQFEMCEFIMAAMALENVFMLQFKIISCTAQLNEANPRRPCFLYLSHLFQTLFQGEEESIGSYSRAEKLLIHLAAATKWYRPSPIPTDLPPQIARD